MRKVKCKVTGEIGYDFQFYKAPNGRYYKNKKIYEDKMKDTEFRSKIIKVINLDILSKSMGNCASLIVKLINESGLKEEVIYMSILNKLDYIKGAIQQSKENDATKIFLIFSIATNKLTKTTYAGCYEIRNNETNEVYIGESIDLFSRFTNHVSELYENKHHCKALQEAFNKNHTVSDFTITPLFIFSTTNVDKNQIKHETLYLESAFYIIAKLNNEKLYNTKNPYVSLKNNNVLVNSYEIDCKEVLNLLVNDKYHVLDKNTIDKIKRDLEKDGLLENNEEKMENPDIGEKIDFDNIEKCISLTKSVLANNVKLYRITNLLKELAKDKILPVDYDYLKIRKILVDKGLVTIDSNNRTVATDYALENEFYYIENVSYKGCQPSYKYFVSNKLKELLIDEFSKIENINELRADY